MDWERLRSDLIFFVFFFGDRLGVLWVSGDQEWERLRLK